MVTALAPMTASPEGRATTEGEFLLSTFDPAATYQLKVHTPGEPTCVDLGAIPASKAAR